jgi:hypothetical protein
LRLRLKPWLALVVLAAAVAALLFGVDYYRHRFVRSQADMVALLPPGDATVFFADVKLLRSAGLLRLVSGSRAGEDPDYRAFVNATAFDYRRDLDALAGEAIGDAIYIVVSGHWDWALLKSYAEAHEGSCHAQTCSIPTRQRGRWISFIPIQPNVIGLAISRDRAAALAILPPRHRGPGRLPTNPVWVEVAQSILKDPSALPIGLRIFAVSLQSADSVTLSLGAGNESRGIAFNVEMDAQASTIAAADTIRNQLEIQTKMLKLELAREHQQPNPADLTGLLTSGAFQIVGRRVIGEWPVRAELLQALE